MSCRLINDAETSLLAQQADRQSSSDGSQGLCTVTKASTLVSDGLLQSVAEETETQIHVEQQASTLVHSRKSSA